MSTNIPDIVQYMNDIMHDKCKVHYIITTKILRHIALSLHNVPINSNTRSQIHWHEQGPLKYIDTKTLGIYEVVMLMTRLF